MTWDGIRLAVLARRVKGYTKIHPLEHVPRFWENVTATPGACGDPECHVLHDDPAKPIHPPWYVDSRTTT